MMKLFKKPIAALIVAALIVGVPVVGKVAEKKVEAANYNLVWSDEFNGDSLNLNDWNIEVNGKGGGNEEHQYYTDRDENIEVSGGSLKIHAIKENYLGKTYTSGRINTNNKRTFKYGKIEARMKLPRFQGAWPAFWMLGADHDKVGWPRCGEIDIMEAINNNNEIHANLHWSNKGSQDDTSGIPYVISDRTAWHTYGFVWTENYMKFYVDDVVFQSYPITSERDMDEFQREQFIILNFAVGGRWPGHTIDDSAFPDRSTMEVDYVRVYERSDDTTTYNGPTQVVEQDLIGEYSGTWNSQFDADNVNPVGTFTSLGELKDGFIMDVPDIGKVSKSSPWYANVSLDDINVFNGATYKLQSTLTADKDKTVIIKVMDPDGLGLVEDYVYLKANEPYSYSTDVKIIGDIDNKITLKYGFGKVNGEAIANYESVNVKVEDISFRGTASVPVPTEKTTTREVTTTTKTNEKNVDVIKPSEVRIKKVYKKKLSAKRLKVVLTKSENANKYQLAVYKTKKKAKKNVGALIKKTFKNNKITIKSKKLKNKKKLYLRARAMNITGEETMYGQWSSVKMIKCKK